MNNKFHIIVTSEDGRSSAFQLSKRKLFITLTLSLTCITALAVFGYFTTGSYFTNKLLNRKVETLQAKLNDSERAGSDYRDQIAVLQKKHTEEMDALEDEYSMQLADQKAEFDLETTNLQLENVKLMSTAVQDLNERSELIESVMDTIGIELKNSKKSTPGENSGGPYIPAEESKEVLSYDELLKSTDEYLRAIQLMPVGRPVPGTVSSRYGRRSDPLNKKKAFHEGVDIRGKRGERVRTTAGGTVLKALKNGSYGNYVEIDHGNGYRTIYAHMQNYLVRKGEKVKQGDVIGQVGNSGRSTGPHLHYEIQRNNKPVDPVRFMKVADLTHTFSQGQE
jgi:murein DD-endopeptidase MepM/ murein hydrolase activator NlpD